MGIWYNGVYTQQYDICCLNIMWLQIQWEERWQSRPLIPLNACTILYILSNSQYPSGFFIHPKHNRCWWLAPLNFGANFMSWLRSSKVCSEVRGPVLSLDVLTCFRVLTTCLWARKMSHRKCFGKMMFLWETVCIPMHSNARFQRCKCPFCWWISNVLNPNLSPLQSSPQLFASSLEDPRSWECHVQRFFLLNSSCIDG